MKKESFKNIILVGLVISSIALTFNMWMQKKLWPDGYNFFSNITKYLNGSDYQKKYYLSKENVSFPKKVVITNTEKRSLYTHTEQEFQQIMKVVMPAIKDGISNAQYIESNINEWELAIKNTSLYFSYPVAYDYSLFSAILGLTAPKQTDIAYIKELLIYTDNEGKNTILFVKDNSTDIIYKTALNTDAQLIDVINGYAISDIASLPFSFELNFDVASDENIEQNVIIEPTVTIPLIKSSAKTVLCEETSSIFENANSRKQILEEFSFNTATANRYRDNNDTTVYVDNYGTLKFYTNGILEYKALDATRGIKLTTNALNTYDSFINGVEFVNRLLTRSVPDGNFDINLSSYNNNSKNNTVKLTFDYYIDGKEFKYETNKNAITLEIVDGNLVYYSQLFKTFTVTGNEVMCPDAIAALDILMADKARSGAVDELFIGYARSGESYLPKWYAKTADGSTYVIGGDAPNDME